MVKVGDRTVNSIDEVTVAVRQLIDRPGHADRCAARRPAHHRPSSPIPASQTAATTPVTVSLGFLGRSVEHAQANRVQAYWPCRRTSGTGGPTAQSHAVSTSWVTNGPLLLIREALSGTTRFMDFSRALPKLVRTILAARLQRLVNLGVIRNGPGQPNQLVPRICPHRDGTPTVSRADRVAAMGWRLPFERSEPHQCLADRLHRNASRGGVSALC